MNGNNSIKKPFILTNIVKKFKNLKDEKNRKIRELKDASTKCFVNIFFDDSQILIKFVYWVFHKINCRLMAVPCNHDEKIIFFFKGGNIMFLWRKIFEEKFGDVDKDISGKTSISDCDFAIYILTKDERRYDHIYSKVKDILIEELEEIGEMFDELLINRPKNRHKNQNRPNTNSSNSEFNCDKFKRNEKKIFDDFFKDFYTKEKIDRLMSDIVIELKKLKGIDFYEEKNYEIFKYNIPNDDFRIEIYSRESLILRPEDELPNSFSLTNFLNTKIHYVTINANIFNNLSKAGHLVGFDLYRIKFNIVIDHILKSKKINLNNFNRLNQQKNFGIPSEFIDISVSKYYDQNLQKLREAFYNTDNKNSVINDKFALIGSLSSDSIALPKSILTMQMKYIVDDLLVNLFVQNSFNPLDDSKYEKRLFRIFFFYIGNNLLNKKKIILPYDIFDLKDSGKKFYQHFLSLNNNLDINYIKNMKGKSIYNFFNIKSQYNDIGYLLQFTILFNKIIDSDEILSEFIKYYNDIYNIINNNNLEDFRTKFTKFKQDLSDNYKKAYEYFSDQINIDSVLKLAGGGKNNITNLNTNNTYLSGESTGRVFFKNEVNRDFNILNANLTLELNKRRDIIYSKLFDIGDNVRLEYKDIDLKIVKEDRNFYPSFESDDNML
jgi:hypothetical protein